MITREHVGKLVRYYSEGWRVGTLVKIEKNIAVIQTMVSGQRNKRVPVQDVEIYKS